MAAAFEKKIITLAKMKVFLAGHNCIVDFTMVRKLSLDTIIEWILASRSVLDLLDTSAIVHFFDRQNANQCNFAAA